jgi:hypothetical protein
MTPKRLADRQLLSVETPNKKKRLDRTLSSVALYVIPAKLLPETYANLIALGEQHGAALCASTGDANVVVTAVRMRARLERYLDWSTAVRRNNPRVVHDRVNGRGY